MYLNTYQVSNMSGQSLNVGAGNPINTRQSRVNAGTHYLRGLILTANNSSTQDLIRSDSEVDLAAKWYIERLQRYIPAIEDLSLQEFKHNLDYVFQNNPLNEIVTGLRNAADEIAKRVSKFPRYDTDENTVDKLKTFENNLNI